MNRKLRKTYKLYIITLIILIAFFTRHLYIPLFFSNKFTVDYCTFYSFRTFTKSQEEYLKLLIEEQNPEQESFNAKIYFCNNPIVYTILTGFNCTSFAMTYPSIQKIYIAKPDLEENKAYKIFNRKLSHNLDSAIKHELYHIYLNKKIGYFQHIYIQPVWKIEGLCEFHAGNPTLLENNTFVESLSLIKSNKLSTNEKKYFSYYLTVKYLIEIKGISIDMLISDRKLNFDDTLYAAIKYYIENP